MVIQVGVDPTQLEVHIVSASVAEFQWRLVLTPAPLNGLVMDPLFGVLWLKTGN
jgi:hypothetical protein